MTRRLLLVDEVCSEQFANYFIWSVKGHDFFVFEEGGEVQQKNLDLDHREALNYLGLGEDSLLV